MSVLEKEKVFNLDGMLSYAGGAIVSKIIAKANGGSSTVFAFDKGQELSEHTAPFDAIAYIIDGACEITIAGKANQLAAGELIVMPANVPHALKAVETFKMLLIMIKN